MSFLIKSHPLAIGRFGLVFLQLLQLFQRNVCWSQVGSESLVLEWERSKGGRMAACNYYTPINTSIPYALPRAPQGV